MNNFNQLSSRSTLLDFATDDDGFIYFQHKTKDRAGIENHMAFFKLSPAGDSLSWVKLSNDNPKNFLGGLVAVLGDSVFFGGMKIVSNLI